MTVTLIAAVARNGVIGADGGIPWRVPGEQAFFKATTLGHTLVMGRATYDSIGRALPGRTTIVLTRDADWHADGVRTAATLEEALETAEGEVYVAGGATVYAAALPYADEQLLSEIDLEPDGDTFYPGYPDFDPDAWQEVGREPHDGFEVVRWRRRGRARVP
jgi:dihydrofolate reductase